MLTGNLAGITYCLRAVYLNRCVYTRWDTNWHTWYFLRPITSALAGIAAYIFVRAGLLILAVSAEPTNIYGALAISYIAGFNVDKFYIRVEEIAKTTWGISKSNTSSRTTEEER
jgi:hypothetical protein